MVTAAKKWCGRGKEHEEIKIDFAQWLGQWSQTKFYETLPPRTESFIAVLRSYAQSTKCSNCTTFALQWLYGLTALDWSKRGIYFVWKYQNGFWIRFFSSQEYVYTSRELVSLKSRSVWATGQEAELDQITVSLSVQNNEEKIRLLEMLWCTVSLVALCTTFGASVSCFGLGSNWRVLPLYHRSLVLIWHLHFPLQLTTNGPAHVRCHGGCIC